LLFSLFSRLGGGWERRAGVMRGPRRPTTAVNDLIDRSLASLSKAFVPGL
jgi:hypothetical protein